MGAILGTLFLGQAELNIVKEKYPRCLAENLTNSDQVFQEYRVLIKGEEEDRYYDFLMDKRIAMSSTKFYYKLKTDKKFRDRVKARIEHSTAPE